MSGSSLVMLVNPPTGLWVVLWEVVSLSILGWRNGLQDLATIARGLWLHGCFYYFWAITRRFYIFPDIFQNKDVVLLLCRIICSCIIQLLCVPSIYLVMSPTSVITWPAPSTNLGTACSLVLGLVSLMVIVMAGSESTSCPLPLTDIVWVF